MCNATKHVYNFISKILDVFISHVKNIIHFLTFNTIHYIQIKLEYLSMHLFYHTHNHIQFINAECSGSVDRLLDC